MARTRTNRRLERPREQVLTTALEMIAEEGLAAITVAAVAARLGTSGGHLLYYFGTRVGLLLETLRWSESQYAEQRAPVLAATAARRDDAPAGLAAVREFAGIYLALDRRDPRWLLWLELWARAPYDEDVAGVLREVDRQWDADLVTLLADAFPGHGSPAERADLSEQLRAMWDGLSIGVVTGGGPELRERALVLTAATVSSTGR